MGHIHDSGKNKKEKSSFLELEPTESEAFQAAFPDIFGLKCTTNNVTVVVDDGSSSDEQSNNSNISAVIEESLPIKEDSITKVAEETSVDNPIVTIEASEDEESPEKVKLHAPIFQQRNKKQSIKAASSVGINKKDKQQLK